jgi:PPM family protein phosphatase
MPDQIDRSQSDTAPIAVPSAGTAMVRVELGALSHKGLVRANNEDSYLLFRMGRYFESVATNVPDGDLPSHFGDTGVGLVVADGVGGHEAGEVASRLAVSALVDFLSSERQWVLSLSEPESRKAEIERLRARATACLDKVHAALRAKASSDPGLAGMGTTFTCAYALGFDLFVLHVGDSKAFLYRGGTLRRITRDHTLAQQYADLGLIEQREVASHRMHHVLTRAVGGPEERLEGDMHLLRLVEGDRVLVCSDGLTDQADEAAVAAVLAEHPASQDACRALVDLALERGGRDNVTVLVAGYRSR